MLQIGYGEDGHFPQYAALHTESGYLRLACGTKTTWGTSVVLLPIVWEQGHSGPTQGAPIQITDCQEHKGSLTIAFQSDIAGLAVAGRLRFAPPRPDKIQVDVAVSAKGKVALSQEHAHKAFKMVMLSSMHLNADYWDTDQVFVGAESFPLPDKDCWLLPAPHPRPLPAPYTFGLRGGRSRWQKRLPSPTIRITALQSDMEDREDQAGAQGAKEQKAERKGVERKRIERSEWQVGGWVSSPGSGARGGPNSDNVAMWAIDTSVSQTDSFLSRSLAILHHGCRVTERRAGYRTLW